MIIWVSLKLEVLLTKYRPVKHPVGRRINSGGASVFAARGKRLCCRPTPANQISSAISVFLGFRTWGTCGQTLVGPLLFPPLSFLSSPFTLLYATPSLLLEVGRLNPARRPGGAVNSTSAVRGRAPVEIEVGTFYR